MSWRTTCCKLQFSKNSRKDATITRHGLWSTRSSRSVAWSFSTVYPLLPSLFAWNFARVVNRRVDYRDIRLFRKFASNCSECDRKSMENDFDTALDVNVLQFTRFTMYRKVRVSKLLGEDQGIAGRSNGWTTDTC